MILPDILSRLELILAFVTLSDGSEIETGKHIFFHISLIHFGPYNIKTKIAFNYAMQACLLHTSDARPEREAMKI